MTRRRRVAVTAPDVTAAGYSGMGLRSLGIANGIGHQHDVRILVAGVPDDMDGQPRATLVDPEHHDRELALADVVITSNALRVRQLATLGAAVVSDLYDPSYFEWLVLDPATRRDRAPWMAQQIRALRLAVTVSEVVLCANDRQRDLYLGATLARRPLRSLARRDVEDGTDPVMVLPNGVSSSEPARDRSVARERLGLDPDATVFLWGGGVWDWMDAEVVVRAAQRAHAIDPTVTVVFLGLRRGNEPDPHATAAEALLEPFTRTRRGPVVVNPRWVSPSDRLDYLAAADAGVLGQRLDLETHFSFRTRLIDCIQVGLPVLATVGDELSAQGREAGWALTSPAGDAEALAANMLRIASDPSLLARMQTRSRHAAEQMSWDVLCEPLSHRIARMPELSAAQRLRRRAALVPAASRALSTHARRFSGGTGRT